MKGFLYFYETIKGLLVTGKHLIKNFFYHTLNYIFRIKTKTKGSVTLQYPEEKRPLPQTHRSRHRMMFREDGHPRCVGCMLCVTVCPSDCIYVEAKDVKGEKIASEFIVDLNRCCFCGYCVEVCPEDAIRMDSDKLDFVGYSKEGLKLDLLEESERKKALEEKIS